jgi:[Skp1-protein]-hydroxyproline N-acetylglucosaminyltransferase
MLRLRPPPPRRDNDQNRILMIDHRNHSVSTQQQKQQQRQSSSLSTQLKSKSATRRGGGGRQQRKKKIDDAHHDDLSSFNRKQNDASSSTQQHHHYRHRQRRSSNQDDRSSEPGIHNNHQQQPQRRRRKGSSSVNNNTQSLFITLIRLVLVSTLVYFIVIHAISILYNIVAFLFGGLLHLSSGRGSRSTSFYNYQRDSAYVQNVEEIRQVLELARTEYDILQTSGDAKKTQLHSVRDEERIGYFEQIVHPNDKSIKLSVPKFYASVSIGENGSVNIGGQTMFRQLTLGKLLTPELARMIGGARSSDPSSSSETTTIDPAPYDRTIFVSIISKSDSQCSTTVSNLFRFATNPERIRVAVVDRTNTLSPRYVPCNAPPVPCSSDPTQMLCKYTSNVDVYEMKLEHDAGVMFARHIGQRMYRGEYYALQVGGDAGIVFSDGWDEELIRQLEATGNEMAVLSTYLSETKIRDTSRPISAKPERFTLCHASYKGDGRERRLEQIRSEQVHQSAPPDRTHTPMLQPFWGSEFSFSRGHYVLQVPYDPKLCGLDEQDEEISMALRAFTLGYDYYTPTQSVIFRTKGGGRNIKDVVASCKGNAKNKSRKRLYSLIGLNNNDEDATPHEYGLGSVRDMNKFFTLFGIHAAERITEHRLCEFVTTGNMHDEFVPHLRQDGMGIDYNSISFRFHELISIHKDSHQ